jgi:hypothetical protein
MLQEPLTNTGPILTLSSAVASTNQFPPQPITAVSAETVDQLRVGLPLKANQHNTKITAALGATSVEIESHLQNPVIAVQNKLNRQKLCIETKAQRQW